jgi:hypothetical protein
MSISSTRFTTYFNLNYNVHNLNYNWSKVFNQLTILIEAEINTSLEFIESSHLIITR